jgi:chemotaxis protein MotB
MKLHRAQSIVLSAVLVSVLALTSCVPSRQFDELQAKEKQCNEDLEKLKTENRNLTSANADLNTRIDNLSKENQTLIKDTTNLGTAMARLNGLYSELNKSYDRLISNQEKTIAGSNAETKKLIAQLQDAQEELQKKEDTLNKTSRALTEKEQYLNELSSTLRERENKINELQSVLDKKDSAVAALKNTVNNALLGFKDNGLTVSVKNGKVYVSLEERLLFQTGSTDVDKKGEEALKQLAKVLEKNPEINVMVEGHTDNVPITGGPIKDNWDLSVMRATAVVRILTSNKKVQPSQLTAAGRSEYFPIDKSNTAEARKKNRRTEIILTPKLDELLKVLGSN